MKKIISLILCLAVMFSFVTVKAENPEYSLLTEEYARLLGRGEVIDGSRTFNWPNAGFEFKFSGTVAEVLVDVSNYDTSDVNGSYFTMAVYDGEALVRTDRMKLVAGWNTIYIEAEGDPEEKTIMLVRSSEACKGTLSMSKIRTDVMPFATSPRARHIEFIGDSYTAGYGNSADLSEADYYCAQNTDNWNSYTGMVARHYGADNTVIAHQGKGLYANRSLENITDNMAEQFNYSEIVSSTSSINMSTRALHDFTLYQPQLVSVWLGTNDDAASVDLETFEAKYKEHLNNIRSKYPDAAILCVSITGSKYHNTIANIVEESGAADNYYMLTLNKFTSTSYSHPDVEEDRRIADQFIAKINTIPNVWNESAVNTELLSVSVDYNTNTVTAIGKTPKALERVSALVLRPGKQLPEVSGDTMLYANQTVSDENGEYSFEFEVEKLAGEYTYYMGTDISDSFTQRKFTFKNYIPAMYAEKDGVKVTKMSELSSGDTINAVVSGFDHEDGFSGMLAIVQFEKGRMKNVATEDASSDTVDYGTEIKFGTQILEGTDSVKLIYMNKVNSAPLIGAYTIE